MTDDRRLARRRVDFKPNWLDRLLVKVAPRWGANRLRNRAMATLILRHYDAAGMGRRTEGWQRRSSDVNAANLRALPALRELSRDLRRNNVYARRIVQAISNNMIGWGIAPKIAGPAGLDEGIAERAMELFKAWAESAACDFDGRMDFFGLQRLLADTVVESGEALVVRQPAAVKDGLAIPLRLQILEPDYLDTAKDGMRGTDGPIVQGVEFDPQGRRVAYWMFEVHPGAASGVERRSLVSRRVEADRVLHVFRMERPGQARGVPWLAPVIPRLQDFDEYEDAVLTQQKVAACFAAFVKNLDGAPTTAENIGKQDELRDELEELAPGHISYLGTGQDVEFATPPPPPGSDFATRNLRGIAAGGGVSFEEMTGDYSQVNFSSARMARLSHWANVRGWRWDMFIPQFCVGVWRWAMEEAAALEGWPVQPTAEWAPPPMPMLEPEKEGLAYQRLVRSGAMTLYQMIRERGEDPEVHLAEIAEGNAKLDELGIVLDCDPRKTDGTGQVQQQGGKPAPSSGGGGEADDAESEDVDFEDDGE